MTERFNIGNRLGLNMTDTYGMDSGTHALKDLTYLRAYRREDKPTPLSSETLKNFNTPMTYFCSFKDLTTDEIIYITEICDANMRAFHLQPRPVGTYSEGQFDYDLYIKIAPDHMVQFALAWLSSGEPLLYRGTCYE